MSKLLKTLENEPKFRQNQVYKAWFDLSLENYDQVTTLSKKLRESLKDLEWLTVKLFVVKKSKKDNTVKALLELKDKNKVETVLMERFNKKENKKRYTVCISTQVGCPMRCVFCATGKLGLKRNLDFEELVDQIRFWQKYLYEKEGQDNLISNIVLMGQGEPLLNYDNVKKALNIILNNTKIGHNHIMISTVGVPEVMNKIIEDKDFPPVRIALSLHSAIPETRSKILPSQTKEFLDFFIEWSKKYQQRFPSRSHFISLEYLMLKNINDSDKDLKVLTSLVSKIDKVRINLIPFNNVCDESIKGSDKELLEKWQSELVKAGFNCKIRNSQGQDIDAACGQLSLKAS